jgi:hypothetical protein
MSDTNADTDDDTASAAAAGPDDAGDGANVNAGHVVIDVDSDDHSMPVRRAPCRIRVCFSHLIICFC